MCLAMSSRTLEMSAFGIAIMVPAMIREGLIMETGEGAKVRVA